jgi:hypothetical protein
MARSKRPAEKPAPSTSTSPLSPAYERARRIAHEFPGVEDSTSYGTPALKVRGALMARVWEDGETLVLKSTFIDRDLLIHDAPETYYFTEHYRNYEWVLVRLAHISAGELRERLEEAWRRVAPAKLLDPAAPATPVPRSRKRR